MIGGFSSVMDLVWTLSGLLLLIVTAAQGFGSAFLERGSTTWVRREPGGGTLIIVSLWQPNVPNFYDGHRHCLGSCLLGVFCHGFQAGMLFFMLIWVPADVLADDRQVA
jgi:hypothetical protein